MLTRRVSVLLDEELFKLLEDYRRSRELIPSRSRAIAELLEEALKAKGFARRSGG